MIFLACLRMDLNNKDLLATLTYGNKLIFAKQLTGYLFYYLNRS